MKVSSAPVLLGRIIAVHGIRGWVKIHSECRPREAIFHYDNFFTDTTASAANTLTLLNGRTQGKGLVAHFANINSRDDAYALVGKKLYVLRESLPPLNDGEYYWTDLIGLTVFNQKNIRLGTVHELFETGANDVMVIIDDNQAEHLIPFVVPDTVRNIDWEKQRMTIDWETDWLSD